MKRKEDSYASKATTNEGDQLKRKEGTNERPEVKRKEDSNISKAPTNEREELKRKEGSNE